MADLFPVTNWGNIEDKPATYPPSPHSLKEIVIWEGSWSITNTGTLSTKENCYSYRKFYLQLKSGVLLEGTRHNDGYIRFVYNLDISYWASFIIANDSIQCAQVNANLAGLIGTKLIAIQ